MKRIEMQVRQVVERMDKMRPSELRAFIKSGVQTMANGMTFIPDMTSPHLSAIDIALMYYASQHLMAARAVDLRTIRNRVLLFAQLADQYLPFHPRDQVKHIPDGTDRVLLGSVVEVKEDRLRVLHFNGEPWPMEPYYRDVQLIEE